MIDFIYWINSKAFIINALIKQIKGIVIYVFYVLYLHTNTYNWGLITDFDNQ